MSVRGNSLDLSKDKLEVVPLCPQDISRVLTKEGILSRSFHVAELTSANKIHVHLKAYVDHYGGYAEHGRYILFGLNDSGNCCVKLTPIRSLIDTDPMMMQKCTFFINNPSFKIDDSIYLTIAGPGWAQQKFQPKERYSTIWTMIESFDCHPKMKEWLENVDEVWVPTKVDFKRFKRLGLNSNLMEMKLGYDRILYNEFIEPINITDLKGRYVFGVLGSWNKRKGVKHIIRAFCKAFKSSDNVSLLLVSKYATRPYDGIKDGEEVKKDDLEKWSIEYEFKKYVEDFKDPPHITLIDISVHENILPHIMKRFNCIVGFSMGESTWLPGLQAAGMKIPIIQLHSECSGFIDYLDDKNSFLCKDVKMIKADDELIKGTSEYYEDQLFAEGNEDELVDKMKEVFEIRKEIFKLKEFTVSAYDSVYDRSWENSVNSVVKRLGEIKSGR